MGISAASMLKFSWQISPMSKTPTCLEVGSICGLNGSGNALTMPSIASSRTVSPRPLSSTTTRRGWYAQIAYRPTILGIPILENLEGVFRYSRLDWPGGTPLAEEEPAEAADREQFSVGVNYWFKPSAVVKIGYDINNNLDGNEGEDNLLVIQVAYGF